MCIRDRRMDMHQEMDLQLFADAGTLVNAGGNYVNAYTCLLYTSRCV